jgi:phenylpropionate dioxygenase-like ring-hydroxylating dioxygenase large terminal subunit
MNRNYPFNCWWVAAAAEEVTRRPLCRWLLEQRVVLYRTEDGGIAALEDRCAHRRAPLSQGKLIGDEIACPYHGFQYDTRGVCTLVPSQSQVPPSLKVRCYPVREWGPFVWIWMGDSDRADPALLPDVPPFFDPTRYIQVRSYTEVSCNYMAIQENVLDLTHIPHLHASAAQDVQFEANDWLNAPEEVEVTDRSVTFVQRWSGVPLAPFEANQMGIEAGRRVNRVSWGTFVAPACHLNGFDVEDPAAASGARARYSLRSLHCTTPISSNRCHYWVAQAQDYGHKVPNLAEDLNAVAKVVIKQDTDVLEAIQTTIEQSMAGDHAPEFLVRADRATVQARQILKKMLEAEEA